MYNKKSRREHRTRQLRFETLEDRRVLAAVTVGTISDVFDVAANIEIPELIASGGAGADGKISLREAIIASNNTLGLDFITFAASLNGKTITLGKDELGNPTGVKQELTITDSVTIDASMLTQGLTIDASGNDPTPNSTLDDGDPDNDGDGTTVIDIVYPVASQGVSLTYVLAGLTITGGDSPDENDSIGDGVHQGGGITLRNGSYAPSLGQISLTIRDSIVTGNHSNGDGGGIYTKSYEGETIDFVIERSVISGNTLTIRGLHSAQFTLAA